MKNDARAPTYETNYMYDLYLLDPIKSRINYVYISRFNYDYVNSYWPFASDISGFFY